MVLFRVMVGQLMAHRGAALGIRVSLQLSEGIGRRRFAEAGKEFPAPLLCGEEFGAPGAKTNLVDPRVREDDGVVREWRNWDRGSRDVRRGPRIAIRGLLFLRLGLGCASSWGLAGAGPVIVAGPGVRCAKPMSV